MIQNGPSNQEKNKILKETHSGCMDTILKTKENYPSFHWSELRYEKTGDTILHVSARLGFLNIIEFLFANFSNVVDCKNNDNKTALHEAAQFAQFSACDLLIKNGADVNALKKADWTPLMLSCTKISLENFKNNFKTVEVLLKSNALVNYQNKDGWSSLHLISREGCRDILELLVKNGVNVKTKTKNGRSALHVSCLHGNLDVTKLLINLGLNVNEKDNCGHTALHEGILGKNIELCRFLIKNKVDLNCRTNTDFSILHLAVSSDCLEIIKFILFELNFDVNLSNKNGFTPLHCAARKNQTEIYEFLLKHGADSNLKDNFGRLAKNYLSL